MNMALRVLGPTRIPRRLSAAELELTTGCPCRCITCGSAAGKPRSNELDESQWNTVIDQLAELGCERLSLLGGEPFSVDFWPNLVRRATRMGMKVEAITSGLGVAEHTVRASMDSGLSSVTVSVDGTEAVHDLQRRVPGSFRAALGAIELFGAAHVPIGVTSQVNPMSLPTLEALAPLLEARGVFGWQLQLTLPMGRARSNRVLSEAQMPDLHATLVRLSERRLLRPFITDNIGYCTPDDTWLRTPNGVWPRCWLGCVAGVRHVGVMSDGRVKGCLALPDSHVEASVRDRSLSRIWHAPDAFRYARTLELAGPCADCDAGVACRGGCLAAALAFHGREGINTRCLRLHARANQASNDAATSKVVS